MSSVQYLCPIANLNANEKLRKVYPESPYFFTPCHKNFFRSCQFMIWAKWTKTSYYKMENVFLPISMLIFRDKLWKKNSWNSQENWHWVICKICRIVKYKVNISSNVPLLYACCSHTGQIKIAAILQQIIDLYLQ